MEPFQQKVAVMIHLKEGKEHFGKVELVYQHLCMLLTYLSDQER